MTAEEAIVFVIHKPLRCSNDIFAICYGSVVADSVHLSCTKQVNFDSKAAAPQFVMHGATDVLDPPGIEPESESVCRTSIEVRLLILIQRQAPEGNANH